MTLNFFQHLTKDSQSLRPLATDIDRIQNRFPKNQLITNLVFTKRDWLSRFPWLVSQTGAESKKENQLSRDPDLAVSVPIQFVQGNVRQEVQKFKTKPTE